MAKIAVLILILVSLARAEPPRVYGSDGRYVGSVTANPYDPDSISNPYGKGNPYSGAFANPYSPERNPYSPDSVENPYAPWADEGDDGE